MERKADETNQGLEEHDQDTKLQIGTVDSHEQGDTKETDCESAADNRDPLRLMVESVLSVVGDAKDKVADESTPRQKDDPKWPVRMLGLDHTVHDQQQADAGIGQWSGERGSIDQAGQRPLLEELA